MTSASGSDFASGPPLPKGWRRTTVGEFCTYYKGGTPFEKLEYSAYGIPVLAKGDIKAFGKLEHSGTRFVDPVVAQERSFYLTEPGDFLMTTRDLTQDGDVLGLMAPVPKDRRFLVNQGVNVVRFNDTLDWLYLTYWTNSPLYRAHMKANAVGSTQIHIRKDAFIDAPLLLPPKVEQRAIARVLGAFDDKIQLNRTMNDTLEAMARALFNSWFVNFEPVHAKKAGRPVQGVDAETEALFPNTFEDSAIGPIPSGWHVESLDAVAQFLNGLPLQKYPAPEGASYLPVIKIAELRRGNTNGSDRANTSVPSEYVIVNGDVVFSWSGSLTAVLWSGGKGALNQHLFKVTSERFPRWLYFRWVLQHLPEFQAIAASKATTMGHIQRGHLTKALVAVPPAALISRANAVFVPLEERWLSAAVESQTLAETRDALLPKLLCGELRVAKAAEE
jgi:type I restriction enzyme S subunit